ncbi:acyl-CoA dehydrogenase family protein [Algiphilus sp.]|uniref:acyl-CoA dehydrogenase family protein n=1 Tax=Algiphilus sp. TaxID=1872431 RepID=UPI002A627A7B|nr:acyl-CoA/acyl-ACP dehydrogenase [Pseudomonadota bacterium]
MNLGLSEDERMIADAAADLLGQRSDSAAVRTCIEGEHGSDTALWQQIASELGWCAVGIDEAADGMGMGAMAQALLFEQTGAHLLCAPFFSTVALGANLLTHCGSESSRQAMLPAVADGGLSLSAPLPSTPDWRTAAEQVEARSAGDDWRLDGQVDRVPDAAYVDAWLVFARCDAQGDIGLFRVDAKAAGATVTMHPGWDATRCFGSLRLDDVAAERLDEGLTLQGLSQATAYARLYLAAEALGGAQRCLELTTAYVMERKQFGRAVGSFQAVKHRCAQMMVAVEALRSGVYGVARLSEQGAAIEHLAAECAAVRLQADEAFFFCAQEAIQLHGGVGFTWEYDPHLYFKRAQAARHWLGAPEALAEETADYVLNEVAA